MTEYFKEKEYIEAKSQRKRVLIGFLIVSAIYLVSSVAILVWYLTLPYMSPTITTVKIIQYSITGVFVIFAFIYLGIPYKRVNRYCEVMKNLATGLRETSTGSFLEYNESVQTKDGVDFKSIVFVEWNKYKKDFYYRKVLVYVEKPYPKFEKDVNVRYVTQGNVLISYEIL